MAALGAAAGAFEGDRAREQERMRRAQLSQQGAMFNANMRQRQAEAERQQANSDRSFHAGQEDKAYQRGWQEGEAERQQANSDRSFHAGQEDKAYNRERNDWQDSWKAALDAQEMQAKQLDMTFQKERLSQFKILAEQERQTIAERKRLSQTALASAMKIGMESGGVVPLSVVQAVAKETGIPFQGMYFAPDGSFVSDVLKDGKTVQEVTPANVQATIMRSMPGVFGEEAAKDLVNERRDKARYSKAGAVELSKAGERLLNIRLGRIERERSDILKELKPDDAKVLLGDKEYQKLKDRLMQLDKDEDAAVYSAYGETTPAPSGAQGGGAGIGYTEQQMNELGGLKVQALREANGDNAKALDIFKQKKKQWELSQVKKDDESGGGEGGGGGGE